MKKLTYVPMGVAVFCMIQASHQLQGGEEAGLRPKLVLRPKFKNKPIFNSRPVSCPVLCSYYTGHDTDKNTWGIQEYTEEEKRQHAILLQRFMDENK